MGTGGRQANLTQTLVHAGQILPRVTLDGADGPRLLARAGNRSVLVVYLHPEPCEPCAGYLAEVADALAELREWATAPVGVVPPAHGLDDPGFPLLHDDGEARRQLGIGTDEAAVILADRWGEVVEVATVGADHGFPLPRQLVESAKILDLSCGECNVPGAEWRS